MEIMSSMVHAIKYNVGDSVQTSQVVYFTNRQALGVSQQQMPKVRQALHIKAGKRVVNAPLEGPAGQQIKALLAKRFLSLTLLMYMNIYIYIYICACICVCCTFWKDHVSRKQEIHTCWPIRSGSEVLAHGAREKENHSNHHTKLNLLPNSCFFRLGHGRQDFLPGSQTAWAFVCHGRSLFFLPWKLGETFQLRATRVALRHGTPPAPLRLRFCAFRSPSW